VALATPLPPALEIVDEPVPSGMAEWRPGLLPLRLFRSREVECSVRLCGSESPTALRCSSAPAPAATALCAHTFEIFLSSPPLSLGKELKLTHRHSLHSFLSFFVFFFSFFSVFLFLSLSRDLNLAQEPNQALHRQSNTAGGAANHRLFGSATGDQRTKENTLRSVKKISCVDRSCGDRRTTDKNVRLPAALLTGR
jgi:hypothetical protein